MPDRAWGFESPLRHNPAQTQSVHDEHTGSAKTDTCGACSFSPEQNHDTSEHENDIFLRSNYVLFMSEFPDDLKLVVESWQRLPEAVKVGSVAMVKAAEQVAPLLTVVFTPPLNETLYSS